MRKTIRSEWTGSENATRPRNRKITAIQGNSIYSPIAFLASSITYNLTVGNMEKYYWQYLKQKEKRRMHWLKHRHLMHVSV